MTRANTVTGQERPEEAEGGGSGSTSGGGVSLGVSGAKPSKNNTSVLQYIPGGQTDFRGTLRLCSVPVRLCLPGSALLSSS